MGGEKSKTPFNGAKKDTNSGERRISRVKIIQKKKSGNRGGKMERDSHLAVVMPERGWGQAWPDPEGEKKDWGRNQRRTLQKNQGAGTMT